MELLLRELCALVSAYCGNGHEGDIFRCEAGEHAVKTTTVDSKGAHITCRNGLPHSFHDEPAIGSPSGDQEWYHKGVLHRDNDQPAIIVQYTWGKTKKWYRHGILHRENDQPAVEKITDHGTYEIKEWFRHGLSHRDNDRPAKIAKIAEDLVQEWYRYGVLHRVNDRPAKIVKNLVQEWYRNGVLHRDGDAPAQVWENGIQEWWWNGKRHRDTGPAICAIGIQEWWRNGVIYQKMGRSM